MWSISTNADFESQYASLDLELQKRVDDALATLVASDNPQKLGEFKKSFRVLAYRVSNSCRIIYNVRYDDKVIELIRVGDHKTAYYKD